jgi:hypothetical protein
MEHWGKCKSTGSGALAAGRSRHLVRSLRDPSLHCPPSACVLENTSHIPIPHHHVQDGHIEDASMPHKLPHAVDHRVLCRMPRQEWPDRSPGECGVPEQPIDFGKVRHSPASGFPSPHPSLRSDSPRHTLKQSFRPMLGTPHCLGPPRAARDPPIQAQQNSLICKILPTEKGRAPGRKFFTSPKTFARFAAIDYGDPHSPADSSS